MAEQNPSEDVISRVDPSFDLEMLAYGTSHVLRYIPCYISKGSKVQIADNAQWFLLLCVVYVDSVLRGDCIDHAVTQTEC